MRKHVIFLLLALSVASMQAQEFQWAKGWTSGDNISGVPSNTIVKSLFDREGNIYILGTFGYGATLDGVELLPMPDPDSLTYSQRQFYMTDVKSTLIAKLSPEGHLLWHKVIKYTQQGHTQGSNPSWMQLVGDSAIVIQTEIFVPTRSGEGLWYIDTLLMGNVNQSQNPTYPRSMGNYTAVLTFDLDGNKTDEHFISVLSYFSGGYYNQSSFGTNCHPFYIDNSGQMYIFHITSNVWHWDSVFLSLDDHRYRYDLDNFEDGSAKCMVLKISPSFEMLWDKAMFDTISTIGTGSPIYENNIVYSNLCAENNTNIILSGYLGNSSHEDSTFQCSMATNGNGQLTIQDAGVNDVGFVLSIDSSGTVKWLHQLFRRSNSRTRHFSSGFFSCAVNPDNNHLYVLGAFGYDTTGSTLAFDSNYTDLIIVGSTSLSPAKMECFFEKLNAQTGQHISYGITKSTRYGTAEFAERKDLIAMNNQVMFTVRYNRDLVVKDSVFHTENYGHALLRYNDSGELISATNFGIPDVSRYVGDHSRAIINPNNGDVLLTGCYNGSIGFDETTQLQGASGCSNVYITLFNDTTLLHPYVPPTDTVQQDTVGIAQMEDANVILYPNPARGSVTIDLGGETLVQATVFNDAAQMIPLRFSSTSIDLSPLPAGHYLLHLLTRSGKQYSKQLIVTR
ncbi:MAG: T9SS type A sorting domain-containing protein [Bacteroidales bacterium]|nr:T9SS type A sorting domain-containing protein [Bacteroidales bacterium]